MSFTVNSSLITIDSGVNDLAEILQSNNVSNSHVEVYDMGGEAKMFKILVKIQVGAGATLTIKGRNIFSFQVRGALKILSSSEVGGKIIIGEEKMHNSQSFYDSYETIIYGAIASTSGYSISNGLIHINGAHASLEIYGAEIITKGIMGFASGVTDTGNLKIRNSRIKYLDPINNMQLRLVSSGIIDIDGLDFIGGSFFVARSLDVGRNIRLINSQGIVMNVGRDSLHANFVFDQLQLIANEQSVNMATHSTKPFGSVFKFRNSINQDIAVSFRYAINDSRSIGTVILDNDINIDVQDYDNNAISGATIYVWDNDSGARTSSNVSDNTIDEEKVDADGNSLEMVVHHYNRTLIYQGVTDDEGKFEFIFIKNIYNRSRSNFDSAPDEIPAWDSRLPMHMMIISYMHELMHRVVYEIEDGAFHMDLSLEQDFNITEKDISVVRSYTEISNADELYDYCKYLKATFPEYPSENHNWFEVRNNQLYFMADEWEIEVDSEIDSPMKIIDEEGSTKKIKIKIPVDNEFFRSKFNSIRGDDTDLSALRAKAKVNIEDINLTDFMLVTDSQIEYEVLILSNDEEVFSGRVTQQYYIVSVEKSVSNVQIFAKAVGFDIYFHELILSERRVIELDFVHNHNIDTSLDISHYEKGSVQYDDGGLDSKVILSFPEIDLSSKVEESKLWLDTMLTTVDFLRLAKPYTGDFMELYYMSLERVFFELDKVEFVKNSSLSTSQLSKFGLPVYNNDGSVYSPDVLSNGFVNIDNMQIDNSLTAGLVEDVFNIISDDLVTKIWENDSKSNVMTRIHNKTNILVSNTQGLIE